MAFRRERSWSGRRGDSRDNQGKGGGRYDGWQSHRGRGGFKGGGHRGAKFNTNDPEGESCRVWVGGCPEDITEREIEREFSKHGPVQQVTIKHSARDTFVFVQYAKESHARDAINALNQAQLFGGCSVKVASANRKVINGKGGGKEGRDFGGRLLPRGRSRSRSRRRSLSPVVRKSSKMGIGCPDSRSPPAKRLGRSFQHELSPPAKKFTKPIRREVSVSPPAKKLKRCVRVNVENLPKDMQEDELLEIASGFGYVTSYDLRSAGRSKTAVLDFRSTDEALKAVEELNDREIEDWDMKVKAFSGASD